MALARELITKHWYDHQDYWAYHDYGIVRMTARLTGLSETEVTLQLHPDMTESLNLIVDEFEPE